MQVLKQDITKQEFKKVYLLFGEETFLVNSYKKQLKKAIIGDDTMNFNLFEGKDISMQEIINTADTMPFFADRRLVMVEDSGYFKKESEALANYIKDMPDTVTIIFVESQVDKRNKLYKRVKDSGYACEFERQTEAELKKWIVRYLGNSEKKITSRALQLFIDMIGDDMENMVHEMDKLISYVGDKTEIYPEDVDNICTRQIVSRIFDMIGAVASRNPNEALKLYYDLLANREPALRILRLVQNQFNQLLEAKDLKAKGLGRHDIAGRIGKSAYIAGKILDQAAGFSMEELKKNVELCISAEEDVKTGRMAENMAVELVIVECSQRKNR